MHCAIITDAKANFPCIELPVLLEQIWQCYVYVSQDYEHHRRRKQYESGGRNDFRTVDLTLPPRPKHTFLMSNFFDFLLPGMPFPKKKKST